MIIGVDYTAAAWQGAGIGRYTRELIHAAVALDPTRHYQLFYAAAGLPTNSPYIADLQRLCATYPHVQARPIPLTPRQLTISWQRLRLPLLVEWFTGRLDLVHAPDFVLPPTRARTLLTVHDLTFLVRPECFAPALQTYLRRTVPRSLKRADLVLVDSHASQHDLERLLGVQPERIALVYPGVDTKRFRPLPQPEIELVRQRLGLPAAFLFFVGTLEPRKNIPRLIQAFAQLAPRYPDLQLVIAGRKGWLYEAIFTSVTQLGLQARIRFLDFVADADLPAVYNLARAFVYPSLYEGFGLPVIEALACGTPTVTSNIASLPEVAGPVALLVDPFAIDAIAEGIERSLVMTTPHRLAGLQQAAQFSWEGAAQTLLECYDRVAA